MKERGNPLLKKLDRYLGIPLVWGLGLFKAPKALPKLDRDAEVRFILLKTAGIGDTILTQGIIREIKENFPHSTIDYVCTATNYGMAKLLPGVNQVFKFELKHPLASLMYFRKLSGYDFLLDFAPWTKINAVITACITAMFKVGFKRRKMHRHYLYDAYVEHLDTVHEIDNYRSLIRLCGMRVDNFLPQLDFKSIILPVAYQKLEQERYCIFHICPGGSSAFLRMWPLENWQKLGSLIWQQYGMKILLTGGKADYEYVEKLKFKLESFKVPVENLAGKANLEIVGKIMQGAIFLVSVNTGIMHFGAALNLPVIALNGPTSPVRWGPLGDKCLSVQSGVSCQPCISLGFETKCQEPKCMRQLTVEQVMQAVEKLMMR